MRPQTLKEVIGQAHHKELIQRQMRACQRAHQPFPHTLFFGPPGVGKTTLAGVIAHEMDQDFLDIRPDQLRTGVHVWDRIIVPIAQSLARGKSILVFIDEIHGLSQVVAEILYPLVEDGVYTHEKEGRLQLPPFSLVGATTYPGMMPAPLLDRFALKLALDPYGTTEIFEIVTMNLIAECQSQNVPFQAESDGDDSIFAVAQEIVQRSRLVPRIAIEMTRGVVRTAAGQAEAVNPLSVKDAHEYFALLRIDELGLTPPDRQYLLTLWHYGNEQKQGLGIRQLSDLLQQQRDYLEQYIEPFLIKLHLMARTRTGRKLTERGMAYLRSHVSAEELTDGAPMGDAIRPVGEVFGL